MQLRAGERRDVIEDLLDIQIFTVMNTLLKDRLSSNKTEITDIKYQIDLLKNRIDSSKKHNDSIREMKQGEVSKLKDKLREQIAFIESEQAVIDTILDDIEELTKGISDKGVTRKKLEELQTLDGELSSKLKSLRKEIDFYEHNDNCPTCKQGIEHDFKTETVSGNSSKAQDIEVARKELGFRGLKVEERLKEIDLVEDDINSKNLDASGHRANHKMALNSCRHIKTELDEAENEVIAIDSNEIKDQEDQLEAHHKNQTKLFDDKETLGIVSSMLKDGGIKTRIIKQYVPVMNKLIGKYLSAMDFFVQFELDENFNETIKSRFRDEFSYASFSEGEKLRIDLALLFTWRAVSKLRNSVSTNLLIMDEIMDSSLDVSGTEEFLKIIEELSADSNIFIISHKGDQLFEKFHSVIKFEKVKNFSRIAT
jgi:chromosome segregation ATPase